MRHYEIVFLVHPDQSDQVPGMVEGYQGVIERGNGVVRGVAGGGERVAWTPACFHRDGVYEDSAFFRRHQGRGRETPSSSSSRISSNSRV